MGTQHTRHTPPHRREVHGVNGSYVSIKLDMQAVENLHLKISSSTVRMAILNANTGLIKTPVLRLLKDKHIQVRATSHY